MGSLKKTGNMVCRDRRGKLRRILRVLLWSVILVSGIFFLYLAGCRIRMHAKAPEEPAQRKVLQTIPVQLADGSIQSLDLTMDQVPEDYGCEPFHHGRVERFGYMTSTYGLYGREEKKIRKYAEVYLPYGYDKSKRYDIVYLMHGAGGSAERFLGSPFHPLRFRYIVDNLTSLGEIRPTIFVGLTYYPKPGTKREKDWDAEYTKQYGKELVHDVLPQVESRYSTYAESADEAGLKKSRWHRTFAGFSMGSVTTYYRLCDSLDYFHNFLAMSGSLYWGPDAAGAGVMSDFGARYIMDAVKEQGYTADDFFLYSCVGSEDFALDVVEAQIKDERKHPEFFRIAEEDWNGEKSPEETEVQGAEPSEDETEKEDGADRENSADGADGADRENSAASADRENSADSADSADREASADREGSVNTVFLIGDGERHHGSHGTDRYLYNALPVLSKLMASAS